LPSFLSTGAKDLLSSMLTVDPLKRISIQEIRKHAWFAKDLPDYLSPLAYLNQVSSYATLNDAVVLELSKKMKYSVATIHHALGERENNQIQVAYRLIIDQLPVGIDTL
jgi:serine/threonine protein kinase